MSKRLPWYISNEMISDEHPTVFFERMVAKWKCQKCGIEKFLQKLSGDNYICNEPVFEKVRDFGLNIENPITLTREQWDNEWDDQMKNGFATQEEFQCQGTMVRIS